MICGHDRETLRWAFIVYRAANEPTCIMHMRFAADVPLHVASARNAALNEVADPAKLAAIIAELMREHNVPTCAEFGIVGEDHIHTAIPKWIELDMPRVRAFALILLEATAITEQDIERMIGKLQ